MASIFLEQSWLLTPFIKNKPSLKNFLSGDNQNRYWEIESTKKIIHSKKQNHKQHVSFRVMLGTWLRLSLKKGLSCTHSYLELSPLSPISRKTCKIDFCQDLKTNFIHDSRNWWGIFIASEKR